MIHILKLIANRKVIKQISFKFRIKKKFTAPITFFKKLVKNEKYQFQVDLVIRNKKYSFN